MNPQDKYHARNAIEAIKLRGIPMRKRRIQNMTLAELKIEMELLEIRQKNRKKNAPGNTRTSILMKYVKYHIRKLEREINK